MKEGAAGLMADRKMGQLRKPVSQRGKPKAPRPAESLDSDVWSLSREWELCLWGSLPERWGPAENQEKTQGMSPVTKRGHWPPHVALAPLTLPGGQAYDAAQTLNITTYLKMQICVQHHLVITLKQINVLCTERQHKI